MRTVEPYHMVNYMGNWHLIAFCQLRREWRDFVFGRMTLCSVAAEGFYPRPRQEWQPHLENTFGIFQNNDAFDVVLRFTPERTRWVRGEIWHEGQVEELLEDGSLKRTLQASHSTEIMMEILRHGSEVEVLEPAWLRGKIVDEMQFALRKYAGCRTMAGGDLLV
ncbi:WYL domain-containing protein [Geomonas diazotrophica]|uniref:WYL domain-containing protein n=1 Tax=Geomonas diazotrophica TaxID=2843197 RepID=UPI001F399C24|nr:WYL domain-containing protein [Geomonas diazotrophica]